MSAKEKCLAETIVTERLLKATLVVISSCAANIPVFLLQAILSVYTGVFKHIHSNNGEDAPPAVTQHVQTHSTPI